MLLRRLQKNSVSSSWTSARAQQNTVVLIRLIDLYQLKIHIIEVDPKNAHYSQLIYFFIDYVYIVDMFHDFPHFLFSQFIFRNFNQFRHNCLRICLISKPLTKQVSCSCNEFSSTVATLPCTFRLLVTQHWQTCSSSVHESFALPLPDGIISPS